MLARSAAPHFCAGTIARKPHASGAASNPFGTAAGPTATHVELPARTICPTGHDGTSSGDGSMPGSLPGADVVTPPSALLHALAPAPTAAKARKTSARTRPV